jgi:hypothetical protein
MNVGHKRSIRCNNHNRKPQIIAPAKFSIPYTRGEVLFIKHDDEKYPFPQGNMGIITRDSNSNGGTIPIVDCNGERLNVSTEKHGIIRKVDESEIEQILTLYRQFPRTSCQILDYNPGEIILYNPEVRCKKHIIAVCKAVSIDLKGRLETHNAKLIRDSGFYLVLHPKKGQFRCDRKYFGNIHGDLRKAFEGQEIEGYVVSHPNGSDLLYFSHKYPLQKIYKGIQKVNPDTLEGIISQRNKLLS